MFSWKKAEMIGKWECDTHPSKFLKIWVRSFMLIHGMNFAPNPSDHIGTRWLVFMSHFEYKILSLSTVFLSKELDFLIVHYTHWIIYPIMVWRKKSSRFLLQNVTKTRKKYFGWFEKPCQTFWQDQICITHHQKSRNGEEGTVLKQDALKRLLIRLYFRCSFTSFSQSQERLLLHTFTTPFCSSASV